MRPNNSSFQGFRLRPDTGRNIQLFDMLRPVVHTQNNNLFKSGNRFFFIYLFINQRKT